VLDAIEAVIENRATLDQQEYTIGSRHLKRMTAAELIEFRDKYRGLVAAGGARGAHPQRPGRQPARGEALMGVLDWAFGKLGYVKPRRAGAARASTRRSSAASPRACRPRRSSSTPRCASSCASCARDRARRR
jgi:hypothetical protein